MQHTYAAECCETKTAIYAKNAIRKEIKLANVSKW